jgi:hypothetical protein
MKNRRRQLIAIIVLSLSAALFLTFFWSGHTQAFMAQVSEEELVSNADLIVTGTVVDLNSTWNLNRDHIYTIVTVQVDNDIISDSFNQKEIALIVNGGLVDGIAQFDTLSPLFFGGERVVLYLQACSADLVSSIFAEPSIIDMPMFTVCNYYQGKKEILSGKVDGILLDQYLEQVEKTRTGITEGHSLLGLNATEEEQLIIDSSPYSIIGFKWPANVIPVKFKVNPSGGPENSLAAIQNAAEAWNGAGANFSFSYDGLHSRTDGISFNGVNEILFYDSPGPELGFTSWQASSPDGVLIEADFYLNTRYSWTTAGTPLMGSPFDVQTAALHEFGHFLGLDHSADVNAIMYAFYQGVRRDLHPDDIAGIRSIYGAPAVSKTLTVGSAHPYAGVVIESSSGHGGTTMYSRSIEEGSTVTLTAPNYFGSGAERKRFNNWCGAVNSNNRAISFVITEDMEIIANYVDDPLNNSNANLSALTLSQGSLMPAFSPGTTAYYVSVPQAISALNIAATLSDASASMTINGVSTASGEARAVNLGAEGTTTPVSVVVTAADGTTIKTYNVSITREGGSSNPSPLFIYYENSSGEIVRVDYLKILDDLFNGDARFRNEVRLKLGEALSGFKAVYVQDAFRTIDYDKALNAGKTYIEVYPDATYWVVTPVPVREFILNQVTGTGEEVVIID